MGGVDRTDQLRSYYTCSRKSQQWWKKLLYFVIDTAVTNAWLCYKWHNPTTNPAAEDDQDRDEQQSSCLSHSQFVMEVAKGLINAGGNEVQTITCATWIRYRPQECPVGQQARLSVPW